MQRFVAIIVYAALGGTSCALAGPQEGGPATKTIQIQTSAKVAVQAELATVKVGYVNHAPTKDAAYAENTRVAHKIVQALLDGHVPKSAIETQAVALSRDEQNPGTPNAKILQFTASQQWQVRIAAADAQKVVDIAVGAGANNVDGVDWDVKDPQALETEAYSAAIERAKRIAEETAKQSGVKLGDIVSVSNFVSRFAAGFGAGGTGAGMVSVSAAGTMNTPLTLYAPKIEREESVSITYAIAP